MFVKNSEVKATPCGDGVERRILGMGGSLMMVEVSFKAGGVGAAHTHPHEQISYVAEGRFEFTMNGETTVIEKGDSYYVAPNVPHGVTALTAGVLIDIFTPQREDFLK